MGKGFKVLFGIVVHIVQQFVGIDRPAFDGAKRTTAYAGFQKWFSGYLCSWRREKPVLRENEVLQLINGTAHSFRVGCNQKGRVLKCGDGILLVTQVCILFKLNEVSLVCQLIACIRQ